MFTSPKWLAGAAALLSFASAFAQNLPDLVPLKLSCPASIVAPPHPDVSISWSVANQGSAEAPRYWVDLLYLSTKPYQDGSEIVLWSDSGPTPLLPGQNYGRTNLITLPVMTNGTYYLLLRANAYNYLQESDTSNNSLALPFTFQATPADLAVLSFTAPSSVTSPPYPSVTLVYGVTNQGPGTASRGWSDSIYLSTNAVFGTDALFVSGNYESTPLPPGGRYWRTNALQLPVSQSGTWYLFFFTDRDNSIYEAVTTNNLATAAVQFQIEFPDLAPLQLQAPMTITGAPKPYASIVWAVTNQGVGTAVSPFPWSDLLTLSTDSVPDLSDFFVTIRDERGPIAPGQTYWRTNNVRAPITESGTWYWMFTANNNAGLFESTRANNSLAVPVTFTILKPDLVPTAQVPPSITGPPYPEVTIVFGATNQGAGPALDSWGDYVFFSTNSQLDASDPAYSFWHYDPLLPGQAYSLTNTFRVPAIADGTCYFFFQADYNQYLYETTRTNNFLTVPVNFHIVPPDLMPVALQTSNRVTSTPFPQITIAWGITNQGLGPAIGRSYWNDQLYLSTNASWDTTAVPLTGSYEPGPVASGQTYWRTNTLQLPIVHSGTYYLILKTDDRNDLIESDDNNNTLSLPVAFTILPPDLTPLVSQLPAAFTGAPNARLTLVYGVTNQGPGATGPPYLSWYDEILLSTDPVPSSDDRSLFSGSRGTSLQPGESYWITNDVFLPGTHSGPCYLIAKADTYNWIYEDDKSNNIAAVPITLTITPADLAPLPFQVPPLITGPPNPLVTLVWAVTNQGIGPALSGTSPWLDAVFLSPDATLDPSYDPAFTYAYQAGPIAPGEVGWLTNTARIPVVQSTNTFLIFNVDNQNSLFESNETNNSVAVPVRFDILQPDLMPIAFIATNALAGPPRPALTLVWGVTNQGPGDAESLYPYWPREDRVYISTNQVLDDSALFVGYWSESAPVPAGGSYWRTNSVRLPVTESGSYHLFLEVDPAHQLYESDIANNTATTTIALTILPPDLAPLALQAPRTVTSPPRPTLTFSWGVTNQGPGRTGDPWTDVLCLSTTPDFENIQQSLGGWTEPGPLQPGDSYWRTNTLTLNYIGESCQYYLVFKTDAADSLAELDPENNTIAVPITFNIQPPDLSPLELRVTNFVVGSPFPTVHIEWGVTNGGIGAAIGTSTWMDRLSLCQSTNSNHWCPEVLSTSETGPIAPGESYWRTNDLVLPVSESGLYYLVFDADLDHALVESCWTNNRIVVPILFEIHHPDLAPIAFKAPSRVTGPPSPSITLMWGVTNQGAAIPPRQWSWSDKVYLSRDPQLDPDDTAFVWQWEQGPVSAGATYWRSQTVQVPITASGSYYLIFCADPDHLLYDLPSTNNTVALPVEFTILPADLAPISFEAPPMIEAAPGTPMTLSWAVTNLGTGFARSRYHSPWCDSVYLSTDSIWDWDDTSISSSCELDLLQAADTYCVTNSWILPNVGSGDYYLILKTDSDDVVDESNEANNSIVVPVTIHVLSSDMAPISLQVPPVITGPPFPPLTLVYALTNHGAGSIPDTAYWVNHVFISTNTSIDGAISAPLWLYDDGPVPAGQIAWRTNQIRLPVSDNGNYYLLLEVDSQHDLLDSNRTNNLVAAPISFELHPPDVAPLAIDFPATLAAPPYPQVTVTCAITNHGPGVAFTGYSWYAGLFLSTSPSFDENAFPVGTFPVADDLAPGESFRATNSFRLPVETNGQYFLILNANLYNSLHELNTNNDVLSIPFTYTSALPDLAPVFFEAPRTITGPPPLRIDLVWGVTNLGPGLAPANQHGSWRKDALWLSPTPDFTSGFLLASWDETNSLAPGQAYWRTNAANLYSVTNGEYFLIFQANVPEYGVDLNFSNNLALTPITINLTPPDLAPIGFQAPALVTGSPYPEVTLVWGVTNQGVGPANAPSPFSPGPYDAIYFSDTTNLQWSSWAFLTARQSDLPPQTSYWRTNTVRLPISTSGTYYLILKTDSSGYFFESDEQNNTMVLPISAQLSPPSDLAVVSFSAPSVVTGPGNPEVPVSWEVISDGFIPVSGSWFDTVNLVSLSGVPVNAYLQFWESNSLPLGASYSRSHKIILPVTETGNYQLYFSTAAGFSGYDLNWDNNSVSVPIRFNITAPPSIRITDSRWMPFGAFSALVYAVVGGQYRLEASPDLLAWTRVLDFYCAYNPTQIFDYEAWRFDHRFYRVAPLTNPPPLQLAVVYPPSASMPLVLKLDGPAGIYCRLEYSTDLVNWNSLTPPMSGAVFPFTIPDPSSTTEPQRFYRAVQTPPPAQPSPGPPSPPLPPTPGLPLPPPPPSQRP